MVKPSRVNGWLWRAVCALIGLVFGAGVSYGAMNYRIGDLCEDMADHEERLRDVERAALEAKGKLDTIEGKLDEALDREGKKRR